MDRQHRSEDTAMKRIRFLALGFLVALLCPSAWAAPALTARLVDADAKAAKGSAVVEVKVMDLKLVDPATSNEKAKPGEGHLHYQVDGGPVIATPTAKLAFHGLAPGVHRIEVVLAGNDHKPLGPEQTLELTVPAPTAKNSAY
jgi:hypothetical protein